MTRITHCFNNNAHAWCKPPYFAKDICKVREKELFMEHHTEYPFDV